jgi:hypothetical protein
VALGAPPVRLLLDHPLGTGRTSASALLAGSGDDRREDLVLAAGQTLLHEVPFGAPGQLFSCPVSDEGDTEFDR